MIEGTGDLTTARTAGFTVLVFASLFTCFTARSDTTSAFASLFANPWLWGAVALSLLLQVAVVHLAFLNIAFGTAPLALGPVAGVRGDGQRGAELHRTAKAAEAPLARRRRPQWTDHLTKRRLAVLGILTLAVGGIKLIEDVVAKMNRPGVRGGLLA